MTSLPIQPRKVAFDVSSVPRHWNGGDPVLTRFFDALSVHFPEGERFFIQSVRNFKDQVTDDQRGHSSLYSPGRSARHCP